MIRKNVLRLIQKIFYWFFKIFTHYETEGEEHLSVAGPAILVVNHLSILDSPLIYSQIKRDDFSVLVATKHRKNPLYRFLVDLIQGIWIDRFILEIEPLKQILAFLKKGGMIAIAPEGTRSRTHQLLPAKNGVSYIAWKTNAVIVPVAIAGTQDIVPSLLRFKRAHVMLRVGEPFRLPPVNRETRDEDLQRNTDEIMCRIALMLPPHYRGYYANHPLLFSLKQNTL